MISIIVPVFNTGSRLETCIDSIENQSLTDWECILVDDGSTDGSGELCDIRAAADSRFRVVHNANRGVSAARNTGMSLASGNRICFIDSDDTVEPDYLLRLDSAYYESAESLAVCGMLQHLAGGETVIRAPAVKRTFLMAEDYADAVAEISEVFLFFSPWCKMYNAETIRAGKLRFDEKLSYGEDLMFNLEYLRLAGRVVAIPDCLYIYAYSGADSLSNRLREKQFEEDYGQWKSLVSFYEERGLLSSERLNEFVYKRLWGIVYDGIFANAGTDKGDAASVRDILSIPEIGALRHYKEQFSCSPWIKYSILARSSIPFMLYFALRQS